MSRRTFTPESLANAITELGTMPRVELSKRWAARFRTAPPSRASREFLERSLAYRLQEESLGGLTPKAKKQLERLAREFKRNPGFAPASAPSIKAGTRLVREWKGEIHEIEVLETGFLWRGESHASLSKIAREITGTRWSGPAFFGLNNPRGKGIDHGR